MSFNRNLDLRRQMELFDVEKFNTPVTIIGAGATGSWLALCLAKLGISDITVYDYDIVEEHNVPNQAFGLHDIGKLKTESIKDAIRRNTGASIKTQSEKFVGQRISGIVFLMVDSMAGRKEIWENSLRLKPSVQLVIEPRMGLDMGRIYNVIPTSLAQIKAYEDTYYSDDEAEVSACGTSMTVVTTAMSIAAYCARQLINFHNGEELDNEILIDLKYNNLITTKWE